MQINNGRKSIINSYKTIKFHDKKINNVVFSTLKLVYAGINQPEDGRKRQHADA